MYWLRWHYHVKDIAGALSIVILTIIKTVRLLLNSSHSNVPGNKIRESKEVIKKFLKTKKKRKTYFQYSWTFIP